MLDRTSLEKSWSVIQIFEFAPERRYCNLEVHHSLILLVLRQNLGCRNQSMSSSSNPTQVQTELLIILPEFMDMESKMSHPILPERSCQVLSQWGQILLSRLSTEVVSFKFAYPQPQHSIQSIKVMRWSLVPEPLK